ncbi:MAG TPA: endospore germination permease [Symbiobacteriaceae bacterium]|nr:endospore germination permease [Symbiobacteriaceae bacterium]
MTRIRISNAQFVCLLTQFNFVATLLLLPAPMAMRAGPDAWLTVPIGMCLGALPVSVLLGLLIRRHPDVSFFEVTELVLGKWAGRVALLVLGAFSLFLTSLIIRNTMDFAAISLLPGTPLIVIAALFTATIAYAAYGGSEVIARLAPLALILATIASIAMLAGLTDEVAFTRVLPVLKDGLLPVFRGAWPSTGWFAEFVAIAPIVFQMNQPKKALGSMLLGNGLAALFLAYLVICSLLVFSPDLTQKFIYPTYALARQVSAGQFLERLELIVITFWQAGMVIKAASTLWAATACLGWSVGLTRVTWLPVIMAAVAMGLTLIWSSELAEAWFGIFIWTPVMLPFEIGLPALLLAASFWKKRPRKGVTV